MVISYICYIYLGHNIFDLMQINKIERRNYDFIKSKKIFELGFTRNRSLFVGSSGSKSLNSFPSHSHKWGLSGKNCRLSANVITRGGKGSRGILFRYLLFFLTKCFNLSIFEDEFD
jgi:hypothetical protein